MKLLLYRFFLNKTEQLTLLDKRSKSEGRIGVLKDVLTKHYHFQYRRSELGYACGRCEDNLIYGKFGRRSTLAKRLAPEADFKRQLEEHWPCCSVFIRIDNDPKGGQTIAVEHNTGIFRKPLSPLQAWANEINETLACEGYVLSIHPVTEELDFWRFVEANKGQIEQVVLSFSAPNLLNLQGALNDDLKKLQREYNATETSIGLSNPGGKLRVSDQSKLVKEGVEYITKGGGEYKLKVRGNFHSSKEKTKYKTLDVDVDLETTDKQTFIRTLKELTKL